MSNYDGHVFLTDIGMISVGSKRINVWECAACGALVREPAWHDEWHGETDYSQKGNP